MRLTEVLLAEIDRESERSRRVLQQVPENRHEWKPHDRSMPFGYLAQLVATMPGWVAMEINQDELDLNPPGGPKYTPEPMRTSSELLKGLEKSLADARNALQTTSEEHLMTSWRLLVGGNVVLETARHIMIGDTLNHMAHHRGQMTVYLRLMGARVPALYGPSADDQRFE